MGRTPPFLTVYDCPEDQPAEAAFRDAFEAQRLRGVADGLRQACDILAKAAGEWPQDSEKEGTYHAAVGRLWSAHRAAAEAAGAEPSPFRRHGDPHGCPHREHSCALGTRMHCRLAPHGEDTPHAMEVSGPYVLEHDDTVESRHVPAQEQGR